MYGPIVQDTCNQNKSCGYGILETVHEGVKFVGRVHGMIAEPKKGNGI